MNNYLTDEQRDLIQDMNDMEDGMIRTADRADIWQDKLIYALCRTNYHILKWILKRIRKESKQ